MTDGAADQALRLEVDAFLSREAGLLDRWRLEEWLTLFAVGAHYLIPSTDCPEGDPVNSLFIVSDDLPQLRYRVRRLRHPQGHAEQPNSVTQRLVTNVLAETAADGVIAVTAAFLIYRTRHEITDTYVGRYEHRLLRQAGELRFLERKAVLAMQGLRPVGTLSIIV